MTTQITEPVLTFGQSTIAVVSALTDEAWKDGAWIFDRKIAIDWFVLRRDGEIVGTIGLMPRGSMARVRGWFVREPYRGEGYGRMLMDEAIREARERGYRVLEVETAYRDDLRRWGFRSTGRVYKAFVTGDRRRFAHRLSPGEQFLLDLK